MTGLRARLPSFVHGCGNAAEVLAGAWVGIVGAGSIGLHLVLHLARVGIGGLVIVDPARLKRESLCTHPILPSDVGREKVEWAEATVRRVSPDTAICAHPVPLERVGVAALLRCRAVLLATDNLAAEIHGGTLCTTLGIPLLHPAVHGETMTAQVRHFDNRSDDGPCPACLYGPAEWASLNRNAKFSCGPDAALAQTGATPTMSVSALCSLAADVAAIELLRVLLDLGPPPGDRLVQFTGYTGRMTSGRMRKNPSCPCPHRRHRRVTVPGESLAHETPAALLEAAGMLAPEGVADRALSVDGFCWVRQGVCACGRAHPHAGFVAEGASSTGRDCASCGAPIRPSPLYSFPAVQGSDLRARQRVSLSELGAGNARVVTISSRDDGALIYPEKEAADALI